jgi:peptide/nickel transport system substrate-binding protein
MFARGLAASIALAGAVTAVAACGSNSSGDKGTEAGSSQASAKGATAIKPGKAGGKLTVLASADVDYLDPGQTYYTFGYMVHYAVNRTLYSFKPDNPEKPVEDLAAGPPEIASDNKTVTVHIKPGVKYAPPVNRAVKAADIKYAFERAFSKEVPSGYAGTYSVRSSARRPRRTAATSSPSRASRRPTTRRSSSISRRRARRSSRRRS